MKTLQELFDQSAKAIIEQGEASSTEISCVYLMKNKAGKTLKCGVGHLLADDEMCRKWGKNGWSGSFLLETTSPSFRHDLETCGIKEDTNTRSFIVKLQNAHDNADSIYNPRFLDDYKSNMRNLAEVYNLNSEVLDNPAS